MVLVGVHPVLTHVPPNSLRSTIATFIPASLKRPARGAPACPVPTMIASYAFDINRSFLILLPRQFARFPPAFRRVLALDRGANENKITETVWKPGAFLSMIESCWVGHNHQIGHNHHRGRA